MNSSNLFMVSDSIFFRNVGVYISSDLNAAMAEAFLDVLHICPSLKK